MIPQVMISVVSMNRNLIACNKLWKILHEITFRVCIYGGYEENEICVNWGL
jgi:hypothetical protein